MHRRRGRCRQETQVPRRVELVRTGVVCPSERTGCVQRDAPRQAAVGAAQAGPRVGRDATRRPDAAVFLAQMRVLARPVQRLLVEDVVAPTPPCIRLDRQRKIERDRTLLPPVSKTPAWIAIRSA